MSKALKSLFNIGLVLFLVVIFSAAAQAEVGAPKIIKLIGGENFSLSGTAPAGSEVLIYLDGNFAGQAETKTSAKTEPSFNFQYKSTQKLTDGTHTVMAVAKDKNSLVLSAPTSEVKFTVNLLPAPTLVAPDEITITAKTKPLIVGLTRSGSLVKIFIDDVYNGKTEILNNESNTANFAYKPFLNLSRGWHKVYAIAEDGAGRVSQMSEVLRFNIELPMPAPTMLKPVVNKNTSLSEPFIVGLAKNDSKIKVYIDKKYNGEFEVKNHQSGTANFAYKPVKPLARGNHLVYAVAIDKRGKQSDWSNTVYFSTKNSAIAQSAQEEKSDTVASIEEPKEIAKINSEVPVISDSSGVIEKKLDEPAAVQPEPADAIKKLSQQDEVNLEKIKSLIGDNTEKKAKTGQGMVDEGKSNQGKLKLSLVLFILFLVGVVAWLLWVNRELVKERREQNEAEDKAEKDKNDPTAGGQENKLL
jgi:cbb3-type cytochrome oxidase subunit 3